MIDVSATELLKARGVGLAVGPRYANIVGRPALVNPVRETINRDSRA